MSELVIETRDLMKRYGSFTAVDSLNLSVSQGEVFGLLGPNGAGKTTTILMLLGLTEPSGGNVRVLGLDPARQPLSVKAHVGYLPDQVGFYDELTARENLTYIAKLNGLSRTETQRRIDEVLSRVELKKVADQRVGTFSHGMRQLLGVADVLLKQPRLIIMDEPTQGLDPEHAREFLLTIKSLKEDGITILLSSHLLHQVQEICDRVGLFNNGKMVLQGTVAELAQEVMEGGAYHIYLTVANPSPALEASLKNVAGVVSVRLLESDIYQVEASGDLRAETARAAINAGANLLAMDIEEQNLEAVYSRYFQEVEHVSNI